MTPTPERPGGDRRRLVTFEVEPDGDEVRVEQQQGREWLVAPVVLIREGVLNGGLVPFAELRKSVPGWNGRPVTAPPADGSRAAQLAPEDGVSGHPVETDDNGDPAFVSANQAPFLQDMKIGHLRNVEARTDLPTGDGQLSANGLAGEAWVDVRRAERLGARAQQAVRAVAQGDRLDVSTGYFHRPQREPGRENGEQYEAVQTDLMPDHLAFLPNERGACSWADGCGAPRTANLATGASAGAGLWATIKRSLGIGDRDDRGDGDGGLEAGGDDPGPGPGPGPTADGGHGPGSGADGCRCHECTQSMQAQQSTGDIVEWEASGGTAYGRVEEVREDEDAEPFDSEIDGNNTVNPPAALIEVYRPNADGEWEPAGTMVAHRTDNDTLTVIDSFPAANTTMTDTTDPEYLADHTAFAVEALTDMSDSNLEALAESVDIEADGGDGSGTDDGSTATKTTNAGGDGSGSGNGGAGAGGTAEVEALREEVETLRGEVGTLREERQEARREAVAAHSDLDEDDLEELDDDAIETLHDRVVPDDADGAASANATGGSRVNYAGQAGGRAGGSQRGHGVDDEVAEAYRETVGALTAGDADSNGSSSGTDSGSGSGGS